MSRRMIIVQKNIKGRCRQRALKKAFKFYAIVKVESSTSSCGCEESSEDDADVFGRVRLF